MQLQTVLYSILFSLLPISELRGAIPYALSQGIPIVSTYLICVGANILVGPLVFLFLSTLHRIFCLLQFYRTIFDKIVKRSRKRVEEKIDRFGYLGLVIFVAIPLPVTGAYTGALGAWVLGMKKRKSFVAIAAGVIIAGFIVATISVLGIKALNIFLK
ncbi:hypothetical protein ES705_35262 [subsurface metagenome]